MTPRHRLHFLQGARFRCRGGAVLTGRVGGFLVAAFGLAVGRAEAGRAALLAWARASWWHWPAALGVLLAAGAAAGYLTSRAPETARSGVPHVRAALQGKARLDWRRVLPVKFLGSALAIGAGFSLGYEGPAVQMGAAAGEMVSEFLQESGERRNYLVACGAGSGLAAAFNAPVAGSLRSLSSGFLSCSLC